MPLTIIDRARESFCSLVSAIGRGGHEDAEELEEIDGELGAWGGEDEGEEATEREGDGGEVAAGKTFPTEFA